MEPRRNKYKKTQKMTLKVSLIAVGLLISMGIYTLSTFNDSSVSYDGDAQKTLEVAYINDENTTFNIEESRFQEMMHEMTHQKVKSRLKHGSLELTSDNVDGMIVILNQNKYNHSELYGEILTKWKNGNYNDIVNDHNEIWKLQNKPDGRALSKMSKTEEKIFIKKNFTSAE